MFCLKPTGTAAYLPKNPPPISATTLWYHVLTILIIADQRAIQAPATSIQHMRVDHCSAHITITEHFLNGTNIVAIFKQMGGE